MRRASVVVVLAIEDRPGPLRERARTVAGIEHRGHASGPQQRVVVGLLRQALDRRRVQRIPVLYAPRVRRQHV